MTGRAGGGGAGWRWAAALTATLLGACAATPPEEDPVQIKLNDLETRLARIERVMSNQSLLDLANQDEALQRDIRGMHNDVDQLTNALEAGRKQQRDLYADLDRRVKALESRGGGGAGVGGGPGASPAGSAGGGTGTGAVDVSGAPSSTGAAAGGDKDAYQAAFDALKDGQYDRAIGSFQKFLASYPDSNLADNAQYWLGEAYYVNKSFPDAQAAFQRLVDKYPQSRKRPDALLKIGFCQYEQKQWELARQTLLQVASQYGDTSAGKLAQQRLDKMALEKH